MRVVNGSEELMSEVCGILGCGAYGVGELSFFFKGDLVSVKMGDGYVVNKGGGVLSARGRTDRGVLLSKLDNAAVMAAVHSAGGGVMRVSPVGSPYLSECDEQGYIGLRQDYEVIWLEKR